MSKTAKEIYLETAKWFRLQADHHFSCMEGTNYEEFVHHEAMYAGFFEAMEYCKKVSTRQGEEKKIEDEEVIFWTPKNKLQTRVTSVEVLCIRQELSGRRGIWRIPGIAGTVMIFTMRII